MNGVFTLKTKLTVVRNDGNPVVLYSGTKVSAIDHSGDPELVKAWGKEGHGKLCLIAVFDTVISVRPEMYSVPETALLQAII